MKIDRLWLILYIAIFVGGAGCSTTTVPLPVESKASPLSFQFLMPGAEAELAKIGLMPSFKSYWQAHRDRNWQMRFSMENLKQNFSEKFYSAYYDKAWLLKSVSVRSVAPGDQSAKISLSLALVSPDTGDETVSEAVEVWILVDGSWKHEVSDPFLTGSK